MKDMYLALEIGKRLIKDIPKPQELKEIYLQAYKEYIKVIDEDIKEVTSWTKTNTRREALEELELEKLHIECFCRFLQENKQYILSFLEI